MIQEREFADIAHQHLQAQKAVMFSFALNLVMAIKNIANRLPSHHIFSPA